MIEHETYSVRTREGVLIARIVGAPAAQILKEASGSWETYQAEGGKRTVAFVIDRDAEWTTETRWGAVQIQLWKGTKIIKD